MFASSRRPFVVAFAGVRDGYQVPLALAEAGQLARFVTDVYLPGIPEPLASAAPKLASRHVHGVPIFRAWSSPASIWHTYAAWRLGPSSERKARHRVALKKAQDALSEDARRFALLHGADLFLYGGYARTAFAEPRLADRRRVLFMYHPHIQRSAEILRSDLKTVGEADESLEELAQDEQDRDIDLELNLATDIVCASDFTARTVEAIGVPREKLRIIPYGIDLPVAVSGTAPSNDVCRFLFVGSGIHRKGVHVLFEAWRRAKLPNAELTLVCRSLTPWLAARKPDDVTVLRGVSAPELQRLYATSSVFVMPSLIEGFGYVYLEAMAQGCFCIGTENTGLPDLSPPDDVASIARAGDVESLTEQLRAAHERWSERRIDRPRIRSFAGEWSWRRFRNAIAGLCQAR